jgi:hypothetical protein
MLSSLLFNRANFARWTPVFRLKFSNIIVILSEAKLQPSPESFRGEARLSISDWFSRRCESRNPDMFEAWSQVSFVARFAEDHKQGCWMLSEPTAHR